MKITVFLAACTALGLTALAGCDSQSKQQIDRATAQVQRLTEELDSHTTDTGTYVRVDEADIEETDPWGTELQVVYAQGGVAETVRVRSAGPDREFNTSDDIWAAASAANFKGIGTGIQQGMEKTATGTAKGLVKGTVAGVKESIHETFARQPKDPPEQKTAEAE